MLRGAIGKLLCSFAGGLGDEIDTTEEILFESECPWRTVIVLEASLETKDNGRGINSTVSENPTRPALRGGVVEAGSSGSTVTVSSDVARFALSNEADLDSFDSSAGAAGALPPNENAGNAGTGGTACCGLTRNDRSPQEIAAERL